MKRLTLLLSLLIVTGCDNPIAPPPPVPDAPTIGCAAPVTISGVTGSSAGVAYGAPVASGGAEPLSVSCTPPSGSPFPLGTTIITCTAVDALARSAACQLTATLTPAVLQVTKFLAFGDSVTEGEDGSKACPSFSRPQCIDAGRSYPGALQGLLKAKFPTQSLVVINAGQGGEPAVVGVDRLPGVLAAEMPQVVMLLDGYNDLLGDGTAAVEPVAQAIRTMIRQAKQAGAQYVFVSTMTPSRAGSRQIPMVAITQLNARLATIVPSEGAILVDAFTAFLGHEFEWINDDGLHPTFPGYAALAQVFFDSIQQHIPVNAGVMSLSARRR